MDTTVLKDGLSVVMIGRNEENNIGRALRNITDIADEIIFVDTGSGDRTIGIAGEYGCRVFEFTWADDFSEVKNHGIEQAGYTWILNIDCDEVIYDKSAKVLMENAMRVKDNPAYILFQDNLYDTGRTGHVKVMRLFRNDPRIRFKRPVHENVCESVYKNWPDYMPEILDVHIRHYGHLSRNADGKHERNIRILKKWITLEPDDIYANYKLAMTLHEKGEISAMFPYLEKTFHLFCSIEDRSTYPFIKDFLPFYNKVLAEHGLGKKALEARKIVATWKR